MESVLTSVFSSKGEEGEMSSAEPKGLKWNDKTKEGGKDERKGGEGKGREKASR